MFRQDLADLRPVMDPDARVTRFRNTSGTTNPQLRIPVDEDATESQQIYTRIAELLHPEQDPETFVMHITPAMQRIQALAPTPGIHAALTYNIDGPAQFRMAAGYEDRIIQQLFRPFAFGQGSRAIDQLRFMPPFLLQSLTRFMQHRGIDPGLTGIKVINFAGGYVNQELRRSVAADWSATLRSTFSCGEANVHATEVSHRPGIYEYPSTIVAEILHPETFKPVAHGEDGLLVLTTLYPFQQALPLIRYALQDVVTHEGFGDGPNPLFSYRGRARHCLPLRDLLRTDYPHRMLGTAEIEDVLGDFREVPSEFYPRFRSSIGDESLRLEVEVTALCGEEWQRSLIDRIDRGLSAALEHRLCCGPLPFRLDISLFERGHLADHFKLYDI